MASIDLEHTVHGAAAAVQDVAHASVDSAHGGIPEIPNVVTLLNHRLQDVPWVSVLHHWENLVFALLVAAVLSWIAWRHASRPQRVPRGWQNLLESIVEGVDGFVCGIIGPEGRRFTPFIGTLFLYIWLMNLSVLVPGLKSSTGSLNTTIGLALCTFGYVQWVGLKSNGPMKYLDHLAGSPRDAIGWVMVPLMFPIHLLGEFIKPLSLSLRLAFNVFAEDVLLAVLLGLGLTAGAALHLPVGLPVQFFVVPLVLIFSTVQALVFSLLSTVYISLVLPHGEHQH